jgi:hypothetical protein
MQEQERQVQLKEQLKVATLLNPTFRNAEPTSRPATGPDPPHPNPTQDRTRWV